VGEEAVEGEVEAGQLVIGGHVPGAGQDGGEVGLLGQEILCAVAEAPGLDQEDLGVGAHEVEEDVLLGGEPGEPRLHAVEQLALGEALPLLPAPRLGADEVGGPGSDRLGGHELPAREDLGAREVVPAALVADGEGAEPVHLVAPEVDADGGVGGARVDVDDRASDGHLAPGLDLVLPAVAGLDEAADEVLGVEGVAGADGHGLDVLDVGAEALDEGPDGGDHDGGRVVAAEAPHGPEAAAHGLDGGADPLEGEGLPGGDQLHLVGSEEGAQVGGEALGLAGGGHGHHDGPATAQRRQPGHGERPCRLGHGQHGAGGAQAHPSVDRQRTGGGP
jgi:hypothetical protein